MKIVFIRFLKKFSSDGERMCGRTCTDDWIEEESGISSVAWGRGLWKVLGIDIEINIFVLLNGIIWVDVFGIMFWKKVERSTSNCSMLSGIRCNDVWM